MLDPTVLERWAKPTADTRAIAEAYQCLISAGKVLPLAAIADQFHEPMAKLLKERKHHKVLTKGLESMPTFSRALNTLQSLRVDEHGSQSGAFMAVFVPSDRMIEEGAKFGTYDEVVSCSAFSASRFPASAWPVDGVSANEFATDDADRVINVRCNGDVQGVPASWGQCRLFSQLSFAGSFITVYGLCKTAEGT